MVSVTSDITASPSFQAPRAKADASPANDSFASLVDSNITAAANGNDRAQDRAQGAAPAPQSPAPDNRTAQSRRDDAPAAERAQPRDTKADKPARNDDAESDTAAADQAGAEQPSEASSTKPAKTKEAGKDDESKPTDAPASDEADATDSIETPAVAVQAGADVADAIAAAIVVPVVPTDVQAPAPTAANAASDGGPLAIAAVSAAVTEAAATPAAAPVGTDAAKIAAVDAKPADVKAAGAEATARLSADAKADDTTTTPAVALPVSTPRPAAPKTTAAARTSATGEIAALSDEPDTSASPSNAPTVSATATPVASGIEQPAAAKPAVKNASVDTSVKAESTGAQTASATAAHPHPVSQQDGTLGQTGTQTSGVQSTANIQPAVQAPVMPSQPSLIVTAASQSAAVPLSGLAMEIAASVRSGKSRFEIRLDPAELGRIDVRIDVDRSGQVTSHLTVEKPETLSLLRQDAPQLQRALNDAGLSTGNGGLQFSLRDQSSSGQNGQSNPSAQRLIITEDEAIPAVAASSYARMLGSGGGVDIRV